MHGFPPAPETVVPRRQWQDEPYVPWAFNHLRELLPTHRVACSPGATRALPSGTRLDLTAIEVTRSDGASSTAAQIIADTWTDSVLVVHDGEVVVESYAGHAKWDRTHLLMSVTKSVVGCVAGVLVGRGLVDPNDQVSQHVPELDASGYSGATVRDLLDMRSGISFREAYGDPDAELAELERWIAEPAVLGEPTRGLYAFLTTLPADRPHGQTFSYRSCETDALGWVLERATGTRMADLISTTLWQPMGAEYDAELLIDGLGTAIHDGGLCATARDIARFGLLLLDGGRFAGADIVPPGWLARAWTVDADSRAAFAASPSEQQFPGGWYRDQLWVRPGPYGDVMLCIGIHGQLVHVNRRTRTVCVKMSTWPTPQHPRALVDTIRAFDEVGARLAGASTQPPGRAGVATGKKH